MPALTDRAAKNITPTSRPLPDGVVTGLRLLPGNSKGRGKWKLRFVSPETGTRRDMGLGTYPEVSIATARAQASQARELISEGSDPIKERNKGRVAAQSAAKSAITFEKAARAVHEDRREGWKNGKHVDQWINTLSTYIFPTLGNCPVDTLRPSDFAEALRPIWLDKAETASRVKQRCSEVMDWCWARELTSSNPVSIVGKLLPKQPSTRQRVQHQPAMPWKDIPDFIANVVRSKVNVSRALLEFVILTAARSGEARPMTWAEVDFKSRVWTVPASRMKTKKEHRVPLSDRAVDILNQQKKRHPQSALVFPAPRGGVLTDMVLTTFLKKHNAKSDVPGRHATAHGFRASFRDWASEHGYSRDLAERALSHTIKNQAEAAYHRTDLLEQRREMMKIWARFVEPSGG